MEMSKLKIAVIGAGTWGQNHIEIYNDHPFAEVVALCDQNAERAQAAAAKYGIERVYTDYRDCILHSGCDAVAVVTPDFTHCDIAIAAAEAKKDMIIEKPLATKRDEIYRMCDAFEKNRVRVMVDFHNRFSPPFNSAKQCIDRGEIGRVVSGYFRLTDVKWAGTDLLPWAAQSSILWFLGVHSLDTLRWLMDDEVKRVYSVGTYGVMAGLGKDMTDQYLTTIEFRNGAVAQMDNGWITPNNYPCVNDMKCDILGSEGLITIDTSSHNLVRRYTDRTGASDGGVYGGRGNGVATLDMLVQNSVFGRPKGFAFESIRSFVDCILSGEEFHVSVKDAANTSLAILAILESAEKREPVEVEF